MKFITLILVLFTIPAFAQTKYMEGREYCKAVQKKENGKWLDVPKDYLKTNGPKTSIYHWFLGNKYDPKKPTIIHVVGGPGGTKHAYDSWHDKVSGLGYNVLYFDQRGYVCSRPKSEVDQADPKFYSVENTARDMEELRKSLGINNWVVYGHSFGAPISYLYASLFPSSVKSLILEGPANLVPDQKKFYDAFKKRIIERTKHLVSDQATSCVEKNNSEFENNIETLASVAGMVGAQSYINLVNSKSSQTKTFPTDEETESLIDNNYQKVKKGRYVFPGADKYAWEDQNTELIVDNDFPCSDLTSQKEGDCSPESLRMKKTFDAKKLQVNVPVYFFLGEMDGTPVEQIHDLKNSIKTPSYLIEITDAGHGTFQDVVDYGGEKANTQIAQIFKKAAEGKPIEQEDVAEKNTESFKLKLHP